MNRFFTLAIAFVFVLGLSGVGTAADEKKKKKDAAADAGKALFAKIDTNSDGKISKEEFTAFKGPLAEKAGKEGKEPKNLAAMKDKVFAKLDANSDGFISAEEFGKLKDALAAAKEKAKKKAK